MVSTQTFERMASSIASLKKPEIKRRLLNFKGGFKFDFTESYLDSLTVDGLRHILLAAVATKTRRTA